MMLLSLTRITETQLARHRNFENDSNTTLISIPSPHSFRVSKLNLHIINNVNAFAHNLNL